MVKFCEKIKQKKTFSAEYWRQIKRISTLEYKTSAKAKIPDLKLNYQTFVTSLKIAELFGKILEKIFTEENEARFDSENKEYVEKFIREKNLDLFQTKPDDIYFDNLFEIEELNRAISTLNKKSAPGPDQITNKHLNNLSDNVKNLIIFLKILLFQ